MAVRDLLLAPHLLPGRAESLLRPYGFRDPGAADRNLQAIAEDPTARGLLAEILEELLRCLADAPDPDAALNHLERFLKASGGTQALLSHLRAHPRAIDMLARTHDFLLKGDVFTKDFVETWIDYKRKNEVDAIRLRPHPWEFALYFDI